MREIRSYGSVGVPAGNRRHYPEEKFKPQKLLVSYDNDEAGNAAANELAQKLVIAGVEPWRLILPANQDVNDVVRKADNPNGALSSLVAQAVRMLAVEEPPPAEETPAEQSEEGRLETSETGELYCRFGPRSYLVRGLEKNSTLEVLRINLRLRVEWNQTPRFHLDP